MNITAYLGLGSNLGSKVQNISLAKEYIRTCIGEILEESSLYESKPWGFDSDNNFINQVVEVSSNLNPDEMLEGIQHIEKKMGRVKTKPGYENRTIDIDILLYADLQINKPHLKIPHPMLCLRNFVLVPLAEIAPQGIHPALNKSFVQLLKACADKNGVTKYRE